MDARGTRPLRGKHSSRSEEELHELLAFGEAQFLAVSAGSPPFRKHLAARIDLLHDGEAKTSLHIRQHVHGHESIRSTRDIQSSTIYRTGRGHLVRWQIVSLQKSAKHQAGILEAASTKFWMPW